MGLTKRKDSYYVEFRVLHDGKVISLARTCNGKLRRWKVGSRNKEEARKQEAIIKTQLLEGMRLTSEGQTPPVTIRHYVQRWLEGAKPSLAVKTYASYNQILALYILPSIGDLYIAALTWPDVKSLLNEKQKAGLSANTVRLIRAVISTIQSDAADENLIPANPILGQRRKRPASQTLNPDVCPLNWDQKQAFENKLDIMEQEQNLTAAYACCCESI